MLERLNDISWDDYTDFYASPATPIPALIRQLHVADTEQQEAALHDIFDRICHQASTKNLTVEVIPFLVDLLASETFLPKNVLISQLRTLAIGLDSDELHYMRRISDELHELKSNPGSFFQAEVRLACYQGVRNAVPALIRLLDDPTQSVRIESTYSLAWFPADCDTTLPRIQLRLSDSMDDIELSNLILSIGLLEFQSSTLSPNREFVQRLLDSDLRIMRYTAAIYLDWHYPHDRSTDILRELRDDDDFDAYPVPFNDYAFWFQYAESRLVD